MEVSGPISPVCSAIGTNSDRADEPESRVLPARERLDADDLAGGQLGLGLEEEDDLAVGDGRAQRAGQRQAARAVAVELRLEQHVAAAAFLGGVHGDVGALVELLDVIAVLGGAGDADRGVDLEREPVDRERLAELAQQLLGDGAGLIGAGEVGQQDAELVAAEAGDGVLLVERGASRSATSCSSRSPAWWPSVSLISLK